MNNPYPNAGFDIFVPDERIVDSAKVEFVSMCIKCEMRIFDKNTPLMLANSVGIIDSGYRGPIIGAFRNVSHTYVVDQYTRLLQICAPDLRPIIVELVGENFFDNTCRGDGGFGSTGK
jgi:dUTP pyrophosphatase